MLSKANVIHSLIDCIENKKKHVESSHLLKIKIYEYVCIAKVSQIKFSWSSLKAYRKYPNIYFRINYTS